MRYHSQNFNSVFYNQSYVTPCAVMQQHQYGVHSIQLENFSMLRCPWSKETFVPFTWNKPQQLPWAKSDLCQ